MFVLATPIVDWNAMWKIFVVALAAGGGVVVIFGFLLLGIKIANRAGAHTGSSRAAGYTLAGVCGAICLGVIVLGVYAMAKKPSSTPAKPKAKSALVTPAGRDLNLVASSR